MCNHKLSVVEYIVADELVHEICGDTRKTMIVLVVFVELLERVAQAVRDLDVLPPDRPHEFQVMVPRYTESVTGIDHFFYQADCLWDSWTAIHEVSEKDGLSPIRRLIHAGRVP